MLAVIQFPLFPETFFCNMLNQQPLPQISIGLPNRRLHPLPDLCIHNIPLMDLRIQKKKWDHTLFRMIRLLSLSACVCVPFVCLYMFCVCASECYCDWACRAPLLQMEEDDTTEKRLLASWLLARTFLSIPSCYTLSSFPNEPYNTLKLGKCQGGIGRSCLVWTPGPNARAASKLHVCFFDATLQLQWLERKKERKKERKREKKMEGSGRKIEKND